MRKAHRSFHPQSPNIATFFQYANLNTTFSHAHPTSILVRMLLLRVARHFSVPICARHTIISVAMVTFGRVEAVGEALVRSLTHELPAASVEVPVALDDLAVHRLQLFGVLQQKSETNSPNVSSPLESDNLKFSTKALAIGLPQLKSHAVFVRMRRSMTIFLRVCVSKGGPWGAPRGSPRGTPWDSRVPRGLPLGAPQGPPFETQTRKNIVILLLIRTKTA